MAKFGKTEFGSVCFFALSVFMIALMVYMSDTSTYGDVIFTETDEWNKKDIVDVLATTDGACPAGYEALLGEFFGTETICKGTFTWSYGACTKSDRKTSVWSTTVYGLSE